MTEEQIIEEMAKAMHEARNHARQFSMTEPHTLYIAEARAAYDAISYIIKEQTIRKTADFIITRAHNRMQIAQVANDICADTFDTEIDELSADFDALLGKITQNQTDPEPIP